MPSHGSRPATPCTWPRSTRKGNAASLIFSLYGVFGSCVTSAETGVVLQNRGAYFSLDPKHPNRLEPGKVPLHTLIASLAFREEQLWAVLGCMGADGQPQIHLQTYVAMIDFGQDIQQALAGPRWLSGRFGLGEARDTLHIEARYPRATIDELERRGHPVDRWGDWNELAGHAHGITRSARRPARRRLRSPKRRRCARLLAMLEFIAEQRIAEAIAKGELDDLPGAGRPLALDDDAHVPRSCGSPTAS